jgi:hypothetical protein
MAYPDSWFIGIEILYFVRDISLYANSGSTVEISFWNIVVVVITCLCTCVLHLLDATIPLD